jgi:hypothetical protein
VIPATHIVALYGSDTDDDPLWSCPVIAFDDDGRPLVLGERGLVPAESLDGFHSLATTVEHTVIPGAGWIAAVAIDDDDRFDPGVGFGDPRRYFHVPVVAWLIDDDGEGVPLVARPDGTTATWEGPVFHPDEVEVAVEPRPPRPVVPGFDPSTLRPRQRPKRPDAN